MNDGKASYEIKNKSLTIGENTIGIVVKAEDGSTREYNLIVKREKLSDNTNLEVEICELSSTNETNRNAIDN